MRAIRTFLVIVLIIVNGTVLSDTAFAFSLKSPEQTGVSLNFGSSYDPKPTFRFAHISLMALYDYEQIMPHPAPEQLRFKFEGSIGAAEVSDYRTTMALNIFALYYLQNLAARDCKPYVEAGIGIAYNDFQVEGQALRFNFNPQAGVGAEWKLSSNKSIYGAFRAFHLSNGNLNNDNRGINAVTMQLGILF